MCLKCNGCYHDPQRANWWASQYPPKVSPKKKTMKETLKKIASKLGTLVTVTLSVIIGVLITQGLVSLSALIGIDLVSLIGEDVNQFAPLIGTALGVGINAWLNELIDKLKTN